MSGNPYTTTPAQTAIAIGHKPKAYIADRVMPRVRVDGMDFKYLEFNKKDNYDLPDDRIGRKGVPNELEFGGTEKTGYCEDRGYKISIPNSDRTQNAEAKRPDPVNRGTLLIADAIARRREYRVATKTLDGANYVNKVTLAAGSELDNAATDALQVIADAIAVPDIKPNIMTLGTKDWTKLRGLPSIVSGVHGNAGESGLVSRQALADLLELEEILVGEALVNTAKPGKPMVMARAWSGAISFTHRATLVDPMGSMTWGFTGQFGDWVTGQRDMPKGTMGLRGGVEVMAGESVGEIIAAAEAGYLFESPFI